MMRVNKASEYAVLALGFIATSTKLVSAREVAEGLKLPYELTAKTLQKLKEAGFVASQQGTQGGYKLIQPLNEISFAQVMDAIEGSFTAVECVGSEDCARDKFCELKTGMQEINQQIHELLSGIKLDQVMKHPIEQKGTQAV